MARSALALSAVALSFAVVLGLGFSRSLALLVAVLVGLAFALSRLTRYVRARRAAQLVERALAPAADSGEPRQPAGDARVLEDALARAVAALRASNPREGGHPLYALPWYLVLGPSGSGKSSAIRCADVDFAEPASEGMRADALGCLLGKEAVLLDVPGDYAEDAARFSMLTHGLAVARARRPLDGIVIVIDVEDLLAGEEDGQGRARGLRQRLVDLERRLGITLPVYVLVTKCDKLEGFDELFRELSRGERGRPWGFSMPFDVAPSAALALAGRRLERLGQVLERRALARLPELRQIDERARVYALPRAFEALREPLTALLAGLFPDDVYGDGAILRGVYFGAVIATSDGAESEHDDALREGGARGYFLNELLSRVLGADAPLARPSRVVARRRRTLALGLGLLSLLLVPCLAAMPVRAFAGRRALLAEIQTAVRALSERTPETTPARIAEVTRLRLLLHRLREQRDPARPSALLGSVRADELERALARLHGASVRQRVIVPHLAEVAAELTRLSEAHGSLRVRPSVVEHARLYELLRGYLALTRPRAPGEPADDARTLAALARRVTRAYLESARGTEAPPAADHACTEAPCADVAAYLHLLASEPELGFYRDPLLVSRARALLQRVPPVELALDRIVAEVERRGWDVGLEQVIGANPLPLTGDGRVPGAFTRRAWETHVRDRLEAAARELADEAWVLEDPRALVGAASQKGQRCALRSAYFARYVESWRRFVGSLRMEEPRERGRALIVLEDLTRGQPPPLERLTQRLAHEARLEEAPLVEATEAAEPSGLFDKLRQRFGSAPTETSARAEDPCLESEYSTAASVRSSLRGFYALGVHERAADDAGTAVPPTGLAVYHEQLGFVRDALSAYAEAEAGGEVLLGRVHAASARVRALIDAQEIGWRPRLEALLLPPIAAAGAASSTDIARQKSDQWCTSVVLPFERTLRGRYPFARAGQDASLADVLAFYRPGSGVLWAAYESILARDVGRSGDRYARKPGSSVAGIYLSTLYAFLDHAQAITTALFPTSDGPPSIAFDVRLRPARDVASIVLTIDGQVVEHHNGPERWTPLRWPGERSRGASLRVRGRDVDELITQEGEWGLLRLLESARIQATPGERFFTARFRIGTGRDVVVDVRPARSESPLIGRSGRVLELLRERAVEVPGAIVPGRSVCR